MTVLERQRIGLVFCSSRWRLQPEAARLEEQLAALQVPLLQCDWHWDQAWADGAWPRLQMRWPSSAKALVVALRALVMGVAHGAPRHCAG
ncbi:hypothetical protein BKE38_18985 [Pseudoroseomonas deserti]|uniref:Uncharacterized protein n=1 Tax=Teichococcus deserti TaxID=1817963 RepID=A0A1V2GZ97_9PROT|nr:hypothetical protein [Pseudoroseomonas deserti]ONG50169.1 hypothetical protein BKE38_18985 [Pseudoroseomonas deserti]